ncbi:type III secretion system translocator chaperone SicA [Rouxiella sp. WC2420]|uniref:Type III secretion system translocator chaperone SicA n=1 Tax=Rouxiella sp. WC2420 TaxID=3234145 RepID=A0AB39VM21_9GAMM
MDKDDELSDMLLSCLNQNTTLKDIHEIPEDMMNGLYAHAYQFYLQGKLDNAETFFKFLCMYDFYNTDYFMGLAAVYHLKKQYQKAADLYAVVFAMNGTDYRSVFYAGQCQLMMSENLKARGCFELVCAQSDNKELLKKAALYLENTDSCDKKVDDLVTATPLVHQENCSE